MGIIGLNLGVSRATFFFFSGGPGEDSTCRIIWVVGRILFLAVVGLRILSLLMVN